MNPQTTNTAYAPANDATVQPADGNYSSSNGVLPSGANYITSPPAGISLVPAGSGTNSSPINSSMLSPATPTPFVTPNPSPIPSIASLQAAPTPPLTETPGESNASDITKELEGLNSSLVGKSAYQTEQEAAAGIPGLTKNQNDLQAQLDQLKNEATAIPINLQTDAAGRGITEAGLAPIQTAALRNNAIKALTISSMLDSTKGLLANAQITADKAVAAKYDPITEKINADTANLKLILNDPQTTIDEKNRAQAQLDATNAKAAAVETAKKNMSDVLSAMQTAAKNGADAKTLQAMQNAPDGVTALMTATNAGYGNSNTNDLMTKYPDAGILPGDTLQTAQSKIMKSPTYTLDQKSKILDIAYKQSEINKNNSSSASGGNVNITKPDGSTASVPLSVAPYYNTSSSGVGYMDASSIQGTAAEKAAAIKEAQVAGIKVITNKNTAADLVNIGDANNKLDTIGTIMANINSPGLLTRALQAIPFGGNWFASLTQSDPQKAASGALQSVGLDIIKAISGVQGFRGNATVIQQVNDHMPTIYDTTQTAAQKIDYIRQLISSREDSILGSQGTNGTAVTINGTNYKAGDTVVAPDGRKGIVNADGTITPQ